MKTNGNTILLFFAVIMLTTFVGCKSDDNDPKPGSTNVGTYEGNIQVSDDPQTQLGYIYNAKVTVTLSGSSANIVVVGDLGVDRAYTGTVMTQTSDMYDIRLERQTKPSDKLAGDRVVIINNKLTIAIDVANDQVVVKKTPAATEPTTVSGKLQLIGTDLLKQ